MTGSQKGQAAAKGVTNDPYNSVQGYYVFSRDNCAVRYIPANFEIDFNDYRDIKSTQGFKTYLTAWAWFIRDDMRMML